jgi:hypothetical protein
VQRKEIKDAENAEEEKEGRIGTSWDPPQQNLFCSLFIFFFLLLGAQGKGGPADPPPLTDVFL